MNEKDLELKGGILYHDFVEDEKGCTFDLKYKLPDGQEIVLFRIDAELLSKNINLTAVHIHGSKWDGNK